MNSDIAVIIVTHNSEDVLPLCLESLSEQLVGGLDVIVVDSGSADCNYLLELNKRYDFKLIETSNVGFSRANNLGYSRMGTNRRMVVFMNPDTILPAGYLKKAQRLLDENPEAAVISGILAGYDVSRRKPTRIVDSTGVFRKWYGRWHDRDQGKQMLIVRRQRQYLPAVCGALLSCRRKALDSLGETIFDPDFFLYKEDIELSLRLRKKGWKLLFEPLLIAYHGRGWDTKRGKVDYFLRRTAAESEVLLYRKHPSPYIVWALLKYFLVRWARL